MSTTRKLGDIPLSDYIRMTRRPKSGLRWWKPGALAVLCVVAFAAGQVAPRIGKSSQDLSSEEARAILAESTSKPTDRVNAIVALTIQAHANLEVLGACAIENDTGDAESVRARINAALGLRNLAIKAARKLRGAAESRGDPDATKYFGDLRTEVTKSN